MSKILITSKSILEAYPILKQEGIGTVSGKNDYSGGESPKIG